MITCITCTGDRPEAFELCRKWINSQSVMPDQWLVIDDGFVPIINTEGMEYVRREPTEGEGHTLTKNLSVAFPLIKGDMVLFIEDDDWYGTNYIATMAHHLTKRDIVGERFCRYYHVPTMQYRRIGNSTHASLCQTGMNRNLFPLLEECIPGDPYVDARLWQKAPDDRKYLITDDSDILKLHCSIKGLKGRSGIGSGHQADAEYYIPDYYLKYLITWVGEENAKLYMEHVGQSFYSAILMGGPSDSGKKVPFRPIPKTVSVSRTSIRRIVPVIPKKETGISVITCTGDRPEAFELCRKWMNNQTVKPDQWIVVDDGFTPIRNIEGMDYRRRDRTNKDTTHTLCQNLLVGLDNVLFDKIIIMEDDDWYDPTYIDYMNNLLNKADLVGFSNLIFYYPKIHGYMIKGSVRQPAFSQTAFNRCIIPIIQQICNLAPKEYELCGKGLVDVFLWKSPLDTHTKEKCIRLTTDLKLGNGKTVPSGAVSVPPLPSGLVRRAEKHLGAEYFYRSVPTKATKMTVYTERFLTVGMKGMPGRLGLTSHHKIDNKKYKDDAEGNLLKSILRSDASFYLEFFS